MLSTEIVVWAKQFFYESIGLSAPSVIPENLENEISQKYIQDFVRPVSMFLYGEVKDTLTAEDVNNFLIHLKGVMKFANICHILGDLLAENKITYTGDLQSDLKSTKEKFLQGTAEFYCCVKGGKPFIAYMKQNKLFGTYPDNCNVIPLGNKTRFPRGLDLDSLSRQNPIMLSDFCIKALKTAVKEGILQEINLRREPYTIVKDGELTEDYVTAVTPELPSYFIRNLISSLPEATLREAPNMYVAAYDYAKNHPDNHQREIDELSRILKSMKTRVYSKEDAMVLTDEVVVKYLHDKYGIPCDVLESQIVVPTTERLYTSAYLLDDEHKNMSAEEFMEFVQESPMSVSGTLDEILLAFCNEENFDSNHTVKDLIHYINDEPFESAPVAKEEKNISEILSQYKVESGCSGETTIDELIAGKKHVPVDDADVTMSCVNDCPWIDDEFKDRLKEALFDEKPMNWPDVSTILADKKVPDYIMTALVTAEQTGRDVDIPRPEVTVEEVTDFLTKSGIPRVLASDISNGKLPTVTDADIESALAVKGFDPTTITNIMNCNVLTDDSVASYLRNKGVAEDSLIRMLRGEKQFPDESDVCVFLEGKGLTKEQIHSILSGQTVQNSTNLDEAGYKVAESLLYDMRSAIKTNDTDELREGLLPIVYSFVRVLMMKAGDETDVANFLSNKKSECNTSTAGFIDNALSKLK